MRRFLATFLLTSTLLMLLQLSLLNLTQAKLINSPSISTGRATSKKSLNDSFISPISNTHSAAPTSSVSIRYEQDINPESVTSQTFAVHAMQTGLLRESLSVVGGEIKLTPLQPFKAGELVQVSATTGTLGYDGTSPQEPTIWQFRTAVSGGSGLFTDSLQNLSQLSGTNIALGDLDSDDDLDAFIVNDGRNQLWLNNGMGQFIQSEQYLGSTNSIDVALGDLDNDGDLDAFVVNFGEEHEIWENLANGIFVKSQTLDESYGKAVGLGDVDGDGDLDAFVANTEQQPNKVWLNLGGLQGGEIGQFADSGQTLGESYSIAVALADLDGDYDLDALVGNDKSASQVWLNQGNAQGGKSGIFSDTLQALGDGFGAAVALGDVDSDHDLDVLLAYQANQPNQLWLNDGHAHFTDSEQQIGSYNSLDVALGDLDSDQDLDAFVVNSEQANKVWLNQGGIQGGVEGLFADNGQELGLGDSVAVALGDLDNSGGLDAFVINDGEDKIWLNQEPSPPNLSISKKAPATAISGEAITYTLIISNRSDFSTSNLLITDRLPTHATYITGGDEFSDSIVSWTIPEIEANSAISLQFVVSATQTITNHDYRVTDNHGYSISGTAVVVTHISAPILTHFVENEVNLVGNTDEVEQLISHFDNLEPLERMTLTQSSTSTLFNYLYQITDLTPVESMIMSLTTQAAISELAVTPQANYLIASSGWRILGSPSATPTLNIPPEYFESQWVWQKEPGIGLFDDKGELTTQGYTGLALPVALFDNSPFSDIGVSDQPVQQTLSKPNGEQWQLSVWHLREALESFHGSGLVAGHGYSAASLINQIAPHAQIHLFRVFNEYGIGDLFTLNQALATFIAQNEAPGVINLSLGVLADPESVTELRSLELLLELANEKGFVIVAAAGNWSGIDANGQPIIGPEQYPARLPFVFSVGGNNSAGERSCFSSQTTGVSAPAGDWNNSQTACDSPTTKIEDFIQEPTQYIVGLDPSSEKTGVSAWTGTSFATPLASGLAALLQQKGINERISPNQVMTVIEQGAIKVNDPDLGNGIINIPNSLSLIPSAPTYRYYMPLVKNGN